MTRCFRGDEAVAASEEFSDFAPAKSGGAEAERNPAVSADVRRAVEACVFQENFLQFLFGFQREAEFALVFLQYGESFLANAKGGVAEGSRFLHPGQGAADGAELLEDGSFGEHAKNIAFL